MFSKTVISKFAVFAVITAGTSFDASAGVRIGNKSRTYADAYNQVNQMTNPRTAPSVVTDNVAAAGGTASGATSASQQNLPIRVANAALASRIANGDVNTGVTINDLERCSMIYPSGEFAWDKPTAGLGRGTSDKCVAIVEIRASGAAEDGSDLVLARAKVAAGDSVRCNISEFPEADYTDAVSDFIFPADRAPTMDDVVKVLNAEQKQNAGFKIAASAVVGALGGNLIGKNDVGKDNAFGTDKGKVQGSVIGALAGAAIGAGNAYAGKIGGDVILSTGINATAGGIMGNVLATGDSVLRIEECEVDSIHTTCLWGYVMDTTSIARGRYNYYFNITDGETTYQCDKDNDNICKKVDLVNIKLAEYSNKDIHEADAAGYNLIVENTSKQFQLTSDENDNLKMVSRDLSTNNTKKSDDIYAEISSAAYKGKQYPAMIPDVKDSTFGLHADDWNKLRRSGNLKNPIGRGSKGTQIKGSEKTYTIENFFPIYRSANDGSIVDFGNKARMKATMTGAGVGGALGAFSAYQGAQSDINERWVAASREYEDSLSKVYCITGSRYLTQYNDIVTILEMP